MDARQRPDLRPGHGGPVALVHFGFNSWGEKYLPYDRDARCPRRVAEHLGMRAYEAPFVLEGGSFFVDGEGTLITTEQCLLNPNRNPTLSREQIERGLRDYLGVETIVWLGLGHSTDRDTDGHIDGIAPYLAPATVALLLPEDPTTPTTSAGATTSTGCGAPAMRRGGVRGDPVRDPSAGRVPYLNFYLANGGGLVIRSPSAPRTSRRSSRSRRCSPTARSCPSRALPERGRRRTALHHPAASGGRRRAGVRCT